MLRTGQEYLAGLRDGRVIYVGAEKIADVTIHPGFRNAAETVSELFDLKFNPTCREDLVVEKGEGAPYSAYFLKPRTAAELEKRYRCHQRIADSTFGLFGRSPDHVASLITGLAMNTYDTGHQEGHPVFRNILEYYRYVRERDLYVVYAVLPGKAAGPFTPNPSLHIVSEENDGIVLRGVKTLATAAVLADEIWIGNLQPISSNQEHEAITCAVPCNAAGLELWSRKAFAESAGNEFDNPLTWRYDEGDAILVLNDVKVEWKRVFVHRDTIGSSEMYFRTPAHCMANHQSAVRSCSKVRFLAGLAHRITSMTGNQQSPAVRETLGRLAALEAALAALVDAQLYRFERWPDGGLSPNRRYVYAALNWCQEYFPVLIDILRELTGSGPFKFPADSGIMESSHLKAAFESFWADPSGNALKQMQLFKLAWDIMGSEFAGRQQQYERFYAGPSFVVRGHSFREAPWELLEEYVTRVITKRSQFSTGKLFFSKNQTMEGE